MFIVGPGPVGPVQVQHLTLSAPSSPLQAPPPPAFAGKFVSGQLDEENPFVLISSALLVQPEKGVSVLVVDRIGDNLPQSTEKSRVLVISVGARHKCQQESKMRCGWYQQMTTKSDARVGSKSIEKYFKEDK
ncbi:hypothetical protein F511_11635 [Dorcoceras hygrometricum]|uniref:Uncharacterized protein n=1 Tax=Dorcoceras hygrometricum TaxID=472368 RepID=A0A2Z7ARV7_9LAMI|nr:hypothetical protein F511_11635 [Dorcoceras hygrometricum]